MLLIISSPRRKMFCNPITACSLFFFLSMKRVRIDSWSNRSFSIPCGSGKMFERNKNSQNMIETIFPQSKYLMYYGVLFSVLSWQFFKGHFQIIIFSQFTSPKRTLLCGPLCFWYVSCSLKTEMSVIGWISALIISGTTCILVRKSKLLR